MDSYFTAGEMAKLFGINIRTLRYYDEIGLLKPAYVNPKSKYRYYTTEQFDLLSTIMYLRELKMPIEEIQTFFNNKDTAVLLSLLQKQQVEIERQRRKLDLIEKKLKRRTRQIEDAVNSRLDVVETRQIPERRGVILEKERSKKDDIELYMRDARKSQPLGATVFLGKVAFTVAREKLLSRQYDVFSCNVILIEEEDEYEGNCSVIPGGEYLTLRYRGTHQEAGCYYDKLLDAVDRAGLAVAGDALEITLIDYCFTKDVSQYITELQIPVEAAP